MALFQVTYERVLPGWDEFGKREVRDITVEAPDHEASFKVADILLGRYCSSYHSREVIPS